MKIRPAAWLCALILSAAQFSCTPMIENGHDHRYDEQFNPAGLPERHRH
jgi:hypothetical protein